MKKRYVLKKEIKEKLQTILEVMVIVGVLALCAYSLKALDRHEYNRAIERCGDTNNIVERYTNQGDKYYQCKVEK